MKSYSLLRPALDAGRRVLRVLYWVSAGAMILGGATGALLLVATFVFPFLPFMGFLLVVQAAGYTDAARAASRAPRAPAPPDTLRSRPLTAA